MIRYLACLLVSLSFALAVGLPVTQVGAVQTRYDPGRPHSAVLRQTIPTVVHNSAASNLGLLPPTKSLELTFGLRLRHAHLLDDFINHEALHGHYLTHAQFDARFGTGATSLKNFKGWAKASGYHLEYVSPDGLTVMASAPARVVSRSLSVQLDRFRLGGREMYANTNPPQPPVGLGIATVTGLSNQQRAQPAGIRRSSVPGDGFTPHEFRLAYNLEGHGADGTGQTIGITGYGPTISNQDLAQFAADTGDPKLSSCSTCTGPDRLQWIQIGKKSHVDATEEALDVEYAHGMALHSHLKYWLGGNGDEAPMEAAISAAANDPSIHVVSNSWNEPGIRSKNDPFVKQTRTTFKEAVAVGTTFYFSTGDNGIDSGCNNPANHCGLPPYPAVSPYVVAVGGTNLQMNSAFTSWSKETAWSSGRDNSSGGGCASFFQRPTWQGSLNLATCSGRAVPDISADGDPNSGAEVWIDGSVEVVGGTSLAAPLIAGMAAVTNRYLSMNTLPLMGFAAPTMYKLARSSLYSSYFHDALCGANGYPAGYRWDEVTGWGSIDWYAYTRGFAGQPVDPVPASTSWSCAESGGVENNLYSVSCPARFTCHAGGTSGRILNTGDGFHWWSGSSSGSTVISIACPSSHICYALGSNGWIKKTTDGGKSWKTRNLHLTSPTAVSCPAKRVCFALGGRSILKTENGKHFVRQSDVGKVSGRLVAVSCITTQRCFAIESNGTVFHTTNGRSWEQVPSTHTTLGSIVALSCPSKGHCYAVGSSKSSAAGSGAGLVYYTSNGSKWTTAVPPNSHPLTGVSCVETGVCDAVGLSSEVLRTTDGTTWSPIVNSAKKQHYNAVACPTRGVCYAVGNSGRITQIGAVPGY